MGTVIFLFPKITVAFLLCTYLCLSSLEQS